MFRFVLTILLVLILLVACSDGTRDKEATQALNDARGQEQLLPTEQSIALYQVVIDKYPKTKQAEEAQVAIVQLERDQRFVLFKRSTGQVLERVSTVLDGFQAYSGKLPLSLKALDAGGYMFDSAYMAEILPDGAVLYLELAGDKSATRMWLQQEGFEQVFSRTLVNPQLDNLNPADLQVLKSKWQEVARVGRLTQVRL